MKKLLIVLVILIGVGAAFWFWSKSVSSPVKDDVAIVEKDKNKPTETFTLDPKNSTYLIEGKIKNLKNGNLVEKNPEFPISAETTMLGKSIVNYDLDRDGDKDIAAIINFNSGGTGTFAYLSVVLNENEIGMSLPSVFLGDRIKIDNFEINTAGEIVLNYFVHGDNQSMAEIPEKEINQRFVVSDKTLTLIK